jgi:hypothetical protein
MDGFWSSDQGGKEREKVASEWGNRILRLWLLHSWGKQGQWLRWVVVSADKWLDGDGSSVLTPVGGEEGKLTEPK